MLKVKRMVAIAAAISLTSTTVMTTVTQASANTNESSVKIIQESLGLASKDVKLPKSSKDDYAEGEFIVKFKENKVKSSKDAKELIQASLKTKSNFVVSEVTDLGDDQLQLVKYEGDLTTQEAMANINVSSNSAIEYVEPNYKMYKVGDVDTKNLVESVSNINENTPQWKPNDAFYNELWGLKNTGQAVDGIKGVSGVDIRAEQAWDITKGSNTVIVGVIDSGVDYNHVDLKSNIALNTKEIPNNGKDDDGNGYKDDYYGWNAINDNGNPMDEDGHGTHCSGTIAAPNNGIGVVGVAPNVKVLPLKFIGTYSGYTSDAIKCINYAKKRGVQVLSNSYGGGSYSQSFYDTIKSFNGTFIAAAGNGGWDQVGDNNDKEAHYPSSYKLPNVVSVAAMNSKGQLDTYSNYGITSVHVGAPGTNILSTYPGNRAAYSSGTSMATPHVAGVAALVKSKYPSYTPAQVKARIESTVSPMGSLKGKVKSGGMVNAAKAVGYTAPVGDNNIPGVALPGSKVQGYLETGKDNHDVYKVYYNKGDMVTINMTGVANTDYNLVLYKPNAKTVAKFDNVLKFSTNKNTSSEKIQVQIPESGYYYINVRAVKGKGGYIFTTSKYTGFTKGTWQDNHPFMRYTGSWKTQKNTAVWGGTYTGINQKGSAEFTFNGTGINLWAYKNNSQGMMKVTVDGKAYNVDLYSSKTEAKKVAFSLSNLSNGKHTVKIEWTGVKSPKSAGKGGTYVNLDAITVK